MPHSLLTLLFVLLLAAGCSTHEPGPAERIGKSLDEIADTIGDIDDDTAAEQRRREREREYDRDRDDYYRSDTSDSRYERSSTGFNRPYSEPDRYDPLRRDDDYREPPEPRLDDRDYPDSRY